MEDISGDKLDTSFEVSLEEVKSRAIRGVVAIMGRGFIVTFIAQISQFFLLAFMDQDQMGIFWIISAAVGFLIFFSDIGLAAALIQKKEKPTEKDLRTTFTVQQGLIIILLVALYFLTPSFKRLYGLSSEGVLLMYALGVSLLFSSLKSIPSVLLERKLEFTKFVIPDVLESFVYSVSVVYFAWQGYGIRSFTYAVLLRGLVGLVAIYIIQPWRPGFAFSRPALKNLFKFGVPYQINTFIALLKDRGVTLALGAVIGAGGVGFLGTAERLSQIPLRQFMDPVTKVTFPAFSRMQEHKEELEHTVTRSIMLICFLVFPSVVGLWLVAPELVQIIPKYEKWKPALTPLTFMTINVMFAAPTTLLTNMLMAIGKIKLVSKLIAMWAVLTILLVPGLGSLYGVNGAAVGYALVSSSSVIAIYLAKKHVNFSLKESVYKALVSTVVMGMVVYLVRQILDTNILDTAIAVLAGGVTYLLVSYLLFGKALFIDAKKMAKLLFNK